MPTDKPKESTEKMSNDDNETYRVRLACSYEVIFRAAPPMVGDDIYCVRCQKMCTVTHAPTEYRIRCRACSYGRAFGAARLNAEMAAARHRKRKPGHPVRIFNGRTLIYTMGADDNAQQPALFAAQHFPQDPPF